MAATALCCVGANPSERRTCLPFRRRNFLYYPSKAAPPAVLGGPIPVVRNTTVVQPTRIMGITCFYRLIEALA